MLFYLLIIGHARHGINLESMELMEHAAGRMAERGEIQRYLDAVAL